MKQSRLPRPPKKKKQIFSTQEKKKKKKNMKPKSPSSWPLLTLSLFVHLSPIIEFSQKKIVFFTKGTSGHCFAGFGVCSDDWNKKKKTKMKKKKNGKTKKRKDWEKLKMEKERKIKQETFQKEIQKKKTREKCWKKKEN